MTYKIIDNALEEEHFSKICKHVFSDQFPWYVSPGVSGKTGSLNYRPGSYYFANMIFDDTDLDFIIDNEAVKLFVPILKQLRCKALKRIKANLYPSTDKVYYHDPHFDMPFSNTGAILYLNDNDGYTCLLQEDEEVKVESVKNRILLFDASKLHRSSTCTNSMFRCNINMNFLS